VVPTRYHVISIKVSETDPCLTYRPTNCDTCCCCWLSHGLVDGFVSRNEMTALSQRFYFILPSIL